MNEHANGAAPWQEIVGRLLKRADGLCAESDDFSQRWAIIAYDHVIEQALWGWCRAFPGFKKRKLGPLPNIQKKMDCAIALLAHASDNRYIELQWHRRYVTALHNCRNELYHRGFASEPVEEFAPMVGAMVGYLLDCLVEQPGWAGRYEPVRTRPPVRNPDSVSSFSIALFSLTHAVREAIPRFLGAPDHPLSFEEMWECLPHQIPELAPYRQSVPRALAVAEDLVEHPGRPAPADLPALTRDLIQAHALILRRYALAAGPHIWEVFTSLPPEGQAHIDAFLQGNGDAERFAAYVESDLAPALKADSVARLRDLLDQIHGKTPLNSPEAPDQEAN